jgi:hypothetical protein
LRHLLLLLGNGLTGLGDICRCLRSVAMHGVTYWLLIATVRGDQDP